MLRSRFTRSLALVLTAFVAISCSDVAAPTAPAAPTQAQNGLLSGLVGTVTNVLGDVLKVVGFRTDPNGISVTGVKWADGHINEARTVSATIGYDGGTLSIPGSDFAITFPRGALYNATAITITSDASGYVSYDMEPHGLRFNKPVVVTQRLRNTEVYGTPLALNSFCAYFPNDLLDLNGILKALEVETTLIFAGSNGNAEFQVWQINHFSRYMLASN